MHSSNIITLATKIVADEEGFMAKGGWVVKFNDIEVERCYAVSFDYDMWEYTVNNKVTKKFPATGISSIKIEIGED